MNNKYPVVSPMNHINKSSSGSIVANLKKIPPSKLSFINGTETLIMSKCDGNLTVDEVCNEISRIYCDEPANVIIDSVYQFIERKVFNGDLILFDSKIEYSKNVDVLSNHFYNIPNKNELIPENILTLCLSIIDDCPLRCIYCSQSAPFNGEPMSYMSYDTILRLLNESYCLGARVVNLTGGEPLLHPKIIEIVSFAYKIGYSSVCISTKATLITREMARNLRASGLSEIQVSIDSFVKKEFDKMVGVKDQYENMLRGMYFLSEIGIEITIKSIITKYNVRSVLTDYHVLKAFNVKSVCLEVAVPVGRAELEMLPSEHELKKLQTKISQIEDLNFSLLYINSGDTKPCGGFTSTLTIDTNGDVILCDKALFLRGLFDFGNIYKQSVRDIWLSDVVNEFRGKRANAKKCIDCKSVLCQGGCIINSYATTGELFFGDTTCEKVNKGLSMSYPYKI